MRFCLHCRCAHGAHEEHEDAFTVAAGTPHVGGLWDCPLVYSTSIAPSQRATAQASKSRVSEYCTASVHKERRARLRYGCSVLGTSYAKSLMLCIVHRPSSGQTQRLEWPISLCRPLSQRCQSTRSSISITAPTGDL